MSVFKDKTLLITGGTGSCMVLADSLSDIIGDLYLQS